jgi:hypothetical protein
VSAFHAAKVRAQAQANATTTPEQAVAPFLGYLYDAKGKHIVASSSAKHRTSYGPDKTVFVSVQAGQAFEFAFDQPLLLNEAGNAQRMQLELHGGEAHHCVIKRYVGRGARCDAACLLAACLLTLHHIGASFLARPIGRPSIFFCFVSDA